MTDKVTGIQTRYFINAILEDYYHTSLLISLITESVCGGLTSQFQIFMIYTTNYKYQIYAHTGINIFSC